MKRSWTKFRTDAFYLPRYLGVHIIILIVVSILALNFIHHENSIHLTLKYFLLLPVALVFGIQIPTLMHNCVHGNLKGKYSNFIIGEITCFFVLMSLSIIGINHTLHHAHADSQEDPHNPAEKTFLQFFFSSLISGVDIIKKKYFKFHGKNNKTVMLFEAAVIMHYMGIVLRLVLWFFILGPNFFVAFFLPAFFFYVFAFAHVNYITHTLDEQGEVQIINVDSNIYYNFINFIGSGVYYHKNHHINPKRYNPKFYRSLNRQRILIPRSKLNLELL